jgi:hypothetical protein
MDERTKYADFDRLEFSEERLPLRVVRGRKVDYERLGLHSAGRLSCMHNKCDAQVSVNVWENGDRSNKNEPMSATTASSLAWFRAARRTLKPALAS